VCWKNRLAMDLAQSAHQVIRMSRRNQQERSGKRQAASKARTKLQPSMQFGSNLTQLAAEGNLTPWWDATTD